MSGGDEDDKPTIVLDLNALKKQKLKQEEDLANIASELEFNVGQEDASPIPMVAEDVDSEDFAASFLDQRNKAPAPASAPKASPQITVLLFDFQSDYFKKSLPQFPKGHNYKIITNLQDLNACLRSKDFQIVAFNYDVNPKATNQLCAQIKQKFPTTKTLIMAKSISPSKAQAHAKTASGASGYYQFPLEAGKIEKEFVKIKSGVKKAA